jgi:hypothetical protein
MGFETSKEKQLNAETQTLLFSAITNQAFFAIFRRLQSRDTARTHRNGSLLLLGVASLVWLLWRTGTKPTRITYPCQQIARDNVGASLSAFIPVAATSTIIGFKLPTISNLVNKTRGFFARHWKALLAIIIIVPTAFIGAGLVWMFVQPPGPGEPNFLEGDVRLTLEPQEANSVPASDIFVTHGRVYSHISELISLMGSEGLLFYRSSTTGATQGPSGLIAANDVVLLKFNSQWPYRGGTNTDMLRELIQTIVDHPDGFTGEIVLADSGQGVGNLNWAECNAEDHDQSAQDVVDMFSSTYQVSAYDWQDIRPIEVDEYSTGDLNDGYIVYDTADPESGLYVSYPKFQTESGTYISFRNGIWNGATYEDRLRVINTPVLKSHFVYGVTGAVKNYMGVGSESASGIPGGLANGHVSVATGGMGTLMAECGLPTLNIMDGIWINANTGPLTPFGGMGPRTPYNQAVRTNVLMASTDPIALDYWAARHVLVQAANITGETDLDIIDPDTMSGTGLVEEFGVWLTLSRDEINSEGYSVTTNENRMNVYIRQASTTTADVSAPHEGQRGFQDGEYELPSYIPALHCPVSSRRIFG